MMQHIPAEIVDEFRTSLKSESASIEFHRKYPEFCNRTMDYFEKMGKFAEDAATKADLERHMEAVEEIFKSQNSVISTHEKRINGLDSRVTSIELLLSHTKLSIDANTALTRQSFAMAEQNLALSKAISSRIDQIKPASKAIASKVLDIPPRAWITIGAVLFLTIALAMGQLETVINAIKGIQ